MLLRALFGISPAHQAHDMGLSCQKHISGFIEAARMTSPGAVVAGMLREPRHWSMPGALAKGVSSSPSG